MPKSFAYNSDRYPAPGPDAAAPWQGLFLGGCAGIIIGMGISLCIGLFYNPTGDASCLVILVSTITGAVFGHVMERLLANSSAAPGDEIPRYMASDTAHVIDLTDRRMLKDAALIHAMDKRTLSEFTTSGGPGQPRKHPSKT